MYLDDRALLAPNSRRPDWAFLHVSPPDAHGFVSLGLEVCTAYAAAETARYIVAQVNPNIPRTHGQSFLHIDCFDFVTECNDAIPCLETDKPNNVERAIGHHIAKLIQDGSTLQMGIGNIPNAVLSSLKRHRRLGIHTGK